MSEDEIKAALSICVEECGDMTSNWVEIKLMWNDEVIDRVDCLRSLCSIAYDND